MLVLSGFPCVLFLVPFVSYYAMLITVQYLGAGLRSVPTAPPVNACQLVDCQSDGYFQLLLGLTRFTWGTEAS